MNFKKATDDLFASISHDDLAQALGSSGGDDQTGPAGRRGQGAAVAAAGLEKAILKLAEGHARRLQRLAERLRRDIQPIPPDLGPDIGRRSGDA